MVQNFLMHKYILFLGKLYYTKISGINSNSKFYLFILCKTRDYKEIKS